MAAIIRDASLDDAVGIAEIYAPVVLHTAISFEMTPPSDDEFKERINSYTKLAPWLVCESKGKVLGYAYAGRFRTREAYQWSAEVTVYVRESAHRKNIGTALYTSLFACLRLQGYRSAFAGITLPNDASVALHERMGFETVGVFRAAGHKFGRWHDVGWWGMQLGELVDSPDAPLLPKDLKHSTVWSEAIEKGQSLLRV